MVRAETWRTECPGQSDAHAKKQVEVNREAWGRGKGLVLPRENGTK